MLPAAILRKTVSLACVRGRATGGLGTLSGSDLLPGDLSLCQWKAGKHPEGQHAGTSCKELARAADPPSLSCPASVWLEALHAVGFGNQN